jgi:hypothetical protein
VPLKQGLLESKLWVSEHVATANVYGPSASCQVPPFVAMSGLMVKAVS